MHGSSAWPPVKGSFNWRLTFTIVAADTKRDVLGPEPETAAVRCPVMPGGLFAIDRKYCALPLPFQMQS